MIKLNGLRTFLRPILVKNMSSINKYDPKTNEPQSFVLNKYDQKIGLPIENFTIPPFPNSTTVHGETCSLEPLQPFHAEDLQEAYSLMKDDSDWTYLFVDKPEDLQGHRQMIESYNAYGNRVYVAVIDKTTGKAVGIAAYMRIDPNNGVCELGCINFSPLMQHKKIGTESIYLMLKETFSLGYRRLEWKCDALNARSRAAALRYGFTFEGIFRQHVICKKLSGDRNRDTAWFSIIDSEWPKIKKAMEGWLSTDNFNADGHQIKKLGDFMAGN